MAILHYEFSTDSEKVVLELDTEKITDDEIQDLLSSFPGKKYILQRFRNDIKKALLGKFAESILEKVSQGCLSLMDKKELITGRFHFSLDGSKGIKLISYDYPFFMVTCDKVTEVSPSEVEEEETSHE